VLARKCQFLHFDRPAWQQTGSTYHVVLVLKTNIYQSKLIVIQHIARLKLDIF